MTHKDGLATRLHSEMAEETMLEIDDVVQKKQNHAAQSLDCSSNGNFAEDKSMGL